MPPQKKWSRKCHVGRTRSREVLNHSPSPPPAWPTTPSCSVAPHFPFWFGFPTHGQPRKGFPFLTRVAGLWSTSASPCFVPVRMSEAELYSECPASTHEFLGDSVVQRKKEARHAEDGPLFWGTWGTPSKSPESMISPKLSLASTRWVLRKFGHTGSLQQLCSDGFSKSCQGSRKGEIQKLAWTKEREVPNLGAVVLVWSCTAAGKQVFCYRLGKPG